MQPALNPGDRGHRDAHSDWCLVSKWRRIVHNPGFERGDVVTLAAPDGSRNLVKRVVGLEGDWIHAADGRQVYITRGLCWVESDNRGGCAAPCDSNEFGPVPVALLKGDYSVIKVMGGLDGWAKRMKASTLRRIICRNAVLRELLHGRPIEVLRVISRLGVDVQVV